MNVNIENTSALRRKLTIELEQDEISRELNRAYGELKRSVQLKGFRPGHAPRPILERLFGDQVRGDVIQKLVKEYTQKALDEHDLKPVVAPEIVTEETDLNKTLKFSAVFDLKPEIVVKDYQDLKVPQANLEVSEQDVDAALERLRERHGTLKKVEGRETVEPDDFVVAGFEAYENGKPVEGLKFEDRLIRVSKETLAHRLDEVLTGAQTNAEVRKQHTYEPDYSEKELAGRTIEWRATVKEIYTRVLPELDDEFAKDQGEYKGLAELRAAVRHDLEEHAKEEADSRSRQGLLDLIIERNPIEVPESLVAREERALEAEVALTYEAGGMPREEALAHAREESEEIKTRAQRRALSALIIDAVANQENVGVSDEEVGERVARMVTQSGRQRDRVAEFYAREENRAALKETMRREKTLDVLLKRAQEAPQTGDDVPANA